MKKFRSVAAAVVSAGVILSLAGAGVSRGDTAAVSYLQSKTPSAWSVMALVAAGQTPSVDFLKNTSATKAIDLEAPIMALAAAGQDPRTFAGADLVSQLKSHYDGTQLGDPTTVNDDIFGLLAFSAAGVTQGDSVVAGVKAFVLAHQNADGGWSYATQGSSDSNDTAAALMALASAGVPASDPSVQNGLAYLKSAQVADGGFTYDPKSSPAASDASSDAWGIMALNRLGIDPKSWSVGGKSARDDLASLQNTAGFYSYQAGSAEDSFSPVTTSYALIALSGKWFPVATFTGSATAPTVHVAYRVEGQVQELCSGETDAVTAMDVVKAASVACGISYTTKSTSFGTYVDSIGGEAAAGQNGWLYLVNAVAPSVGADAYTLKAGDDVVWFYGAYGWQPLRLTLSSGAVSSTVAASATVEVFNSPSWQPLGGATVHAGSTTVQTSASGTAMLSLPDGAYRVFAENAGYVRSNWVRLAVGNESSASLGLSVTIPGAGASPAAPSGGGGGGTPGNSVGFSVTPSDGGSSLDFENIAAGGTGRKSVTIKNQGSVPVSVASEVTGDNLFTSFILVGGQAWDMFSASLAVQESTTTQVQLSVPPGESAGAKTGTLTFWASPAR